MGLGSRLGLGPGRIRARVRVTASIGTMARLRARGSAVVQRSLSLASAALIFAGETPASLAASTAACLGLGLGSG